MNKYWACACTNRARRQSGRKKKCWRVEPTNITISSNSLKNLCTKFNKIDRMRTYSGDFILLSESYWNFSVVDDELHSISTCDETKPHQVTDQEIHDLVTQPVFYSSSTLIATGTSLGGNRTKGAMAFAWRTTKIKEKRKEKNRREEKGNHTKRVI